MPGHGHAAPSPPSPRRQEQPPGRAARSPLGARVLETRARRQLRWALLLWWRGGGRCPGDAPCNWGLQGQRLLPATGLPQFGKVLGSPPPPCPTSSPGLEGCPHRPRNRSRKGRKNWNWEALSTLNQQQSFPGLYVASSCLLSNLWPQQICFPALEVMWSPLRKATSLSFVFKIRIYLRGSGGREAPFARICGRRRGAAAGRPCRPPPGLSSLQVYHRPLAAPPTAPPTPRPPRPSSLPCPLLAERCVNCGVGPADRMHQDRSIQGPLAQTALPILMLTLPM